MPFIAAIADSRFPADDQGNHSDLKHMIIAAFLFVPELWAAREWKLTKVESEKKDK